MSPSLTWPQSALAARYVVCVLLQCVHLSFVRLPLLTQDNSNFSTNVCLLN